MLYPNPQWTPLTLWGNTCVPFSHLIWLTEWGTGRLRNLSKPTPRGKKPGFNPAAWPHSPSGASKAMLSEEKDFAALLTLYTFLLMSSQGPCFQGEDYQNTKSLICVPPLAGKSHWFLALHKSQDFSFKHKIILFFQCTTVLPILLFLTHKTYC